MVDFNNETTIGTPAADVQKILVLECRQYAKEAIGAYIKVYGNNSQVHEDNSVIKSRLYEYFLEVEQILKRSIGDEVTTDMREKILNADDFGQLDTIYRSINDVLDEKRIIRIDTKKQYDSTRVIQEDEANEL